MTRKWSYLAVGMVAIAGFLFAYNAQAKYVASKSLTVTVNIEKHYEVAFDANGGTGTMPNQRFTSGVPQTLTANSYTNAGSYFLGWNLVQGGGTSGDFFTDEALISTDFTNIGGDTVTLYAQWGTGAMQTVFEINGTCIFHGYDLIQQTGDGHITGTNCTYGGTDWADGTHQYIDAGIKLYDSTNYDKDYEVGFTITSYDPNHQYYGQGETASNSQATFFNSKLEDSARHWPGIVIRRSTNKIEITETITKPNGTYKKEAVTSASTTPVTVVITRADGVVYYSVNGGTFTALQDTNGTSDYFDVNAWFGAAAKADGTPMRYIDATMTDLYIKVGEKGANKHTVSFDAGGVTADPSDIYIIGKSKIGSQMPNIPSYVDTQDGRRYFGGWYSGTNGTGVRYTEDSVIESDITLHALWLTSVSVCRIDGTTYEATLQECIDNASVGSTIMLLDDLREQVQVAVGQDITLDLNGYQLRDNNVTGQPVIKNEGKLTVTNGKVTSSLGAGVINNLSTGELEVGNGARIEATGTRQAVWNDGGVVVISGDAYLKAVSSLRATLHSLGGSVTIEGGTIIATNQEAVKIEAGTLTIGVQDGTIDRTTPIMQGATNGLTTSVDVSMYDGTLRGKGAAINDATKITATETGATAVGINPVATETVDGVVYKVIYYQ